jgi:hypothetical protein
MTTTVSKKVSGKHLHKCSVLFIFNTKKYYAFVSRAWLNCIKFVSVYAESFYFLAAPGNYYDCLRDYLLWFVSICLLHTAK